MGYIFYLFLLIAIINLVNNAVKRARSHEESRRSPGRSRPAMQSRPAGSQSRLEKSRPGDAKTELPLTIGGHRVELWQEYGIFLIPPFVLLAFMIGQLCGKERRPDLAKEAL